MGNSDSRFRDLSAKSLRKVCVIGEGSYGTVYKVVHRDSREEFAMKLLKKKTLVEEGLLEHLMNERDIMISIGSKHPFIAELAFAFTSSDAFHFLMKDQLGGSLFHHLRGRSHPFSEKQARFYAAEIVLALQALHQQNYVYRDLKLENVSVGLDGHITLVDFGFTRKIVGNLGRVNSFSGSNIYISPEILGDQGEGHAYSVDWWGLGVLLHLLLTQQAPFWSDSNEELFRMIREGDDPDFSSYNLSDSAKALLSELLTRDPTKRLGSVPPRSLQDAESLAGAKEADQNGAKFVKQHEFFKGIDWEQVLKKKLQPPILPSSQFLKEHFPAGQALPVEASRPLSKEDEETLAPYVEAFPYNHLQKSGTGASSASGGRDGKGAEEEEEDEEAAKLTVLCRNCHKNVSVFDVDTHSTECSVTLKEEAE